MLFAVPPPPKSVITHAFLDAEGAVALGLQLLPIVCHSLVFRSAGPYPCSTVHRNPAPTPLPTTVLSDQGLLKPTPGGGRASQRLFSQPANIFRLARGTPVPSRIPLERILPVGQTRKWKGSLRPTVGMSMSGSIEPDRWLAPYLALPFCPRVLFILGRAEQVPQCSWSFSLELVTGVACISKKLRLLNKLFSSNASCTNFGIL